MKVPYNEKTHHIYETIAKVAREIAAREGGRCEGKTHSQAQEGAA